MIRSLASMAILLMPLLLPPLLAAAQNGGSKEQAEAGRRLRTFTVVFVAKERIQAPTDVARWKAAW